MNEFTTNLALYGSVVMYTLMTGAILFFILAYRSKQRKHIREQEILIESFNGELQKAKIEMTEITLGRVSREVHDNIGQTMSLLLIETRSLNQLNDGKFNHSLELINKAIKDLRAVSHSLSNHQLELGLKDAIAKELDRMKQVGKYHTNLICLDDDSIEVRKSDISEQERDLLVFRCIQELLSNIMKHSKASTIEVKMVSSNDYWVKISVADDGIGFKTDTFKDGIGLKNIRDRLKLMGGGIDIKSEPTKGTCIDLTL
jgi:signal transduction histidine kinase